MLGRTRGVAALIALVCLWTGCSADPGPGPGPGTDPGSGEPAAAPELERVWETSSWQTVPDDANDRWWISADVVGGGVGWGSTQRPGPFVVGDATTGRHHPARGVPGFTCATAMAPGEPFVAVLSTDRDRADLLGSPTPRCTYLTLVDLRTHALVWRTRIKPVRPATAYDLRLGDGTVTLTASDRDPWCWTTTTAITHPGACRPPSDPGLLDADGSALALEGQRELVRTDAVIVVNGLRDGTPVASAHDATTGEQLWERGLEVDPAPAEHWARDETYAGAGGRLVHVGYEYAQPDEAGAQTATVAVLSAVDPATGEPGDELGRVTGGLFTALVGDVALLAVDQDVTMGSHLAGFGLPE